MPLSITSVVPRDWQGRLYTNEGDIIYVRVDTTDVNLREAIQIVPYGSAFAPDSASQTVSFAPGDQPSKTIAFATSNDTVYEPQESFGLTYNTINGYVYSSELYGSLLNNDPLPTVSLSVRDNVLVENAAARTFAITVSRAGQDLSMTTDVEMRFQPSGPTPATASDFQNDDLSTRIIRFAPGETSKAVNLTIAADRAVEGTESLEVHLESANSISSATYYPSPQYTPIDKNSAVISIIDAGATPPPSPIPIDVYRFYRPEAGTHFFTASAQERDIIRNTFSESFTYEGVGFKAVSDQPGADAVYRFYRPESGTHFYTPSEQERDYIRDNFGAAFSYEGPAFYASNKDGAGLTEVYRFYRADTGTHFYTPSILEKSTIEANFAGTFKYEGVAFWVPDGNDYLLT